MRKFNILNEAFVGPFLDGPYKGFRYAANRNWMDGKILIGTTELQYVRYKWNAERRGWELRSIHSEKEYVHFDNT